MEMKQPYTMTEPFVFWGLALFPQWNVLLRRVGELFKTWASRITARAAPGEASGICPEYGAASGGARMRGRASGTEERRTWPYMKKTPAETCRNHSSSTEKLEKKVVCSPYCGDETTISYVRAFEEGRLMEAPNSRLMLLGGFQTDNAEAP